MSKTDRFRQPSIYRIYSPITYRIRIFFRPSPDINSAIQTLIGKLFSHFQSNVVEPYKFSQQVQFPVQTKFVRNFPSGRAIFRRAMNIAGDSRTFSYRTRYSVLDRRKQITVK